MAVSEHGICCVVLPKNDKKAVERELMSSACGGRGAEPSAVPSATLLTSTVMLLQKYCSGERVSFDLSLDLRYYTAFQQAVWRATAKIPYGQTRSYAWIAKRIKNPNAVRAVGRALGANPIPIIIP